ncbi:MAG TPA: hypothetical protein VFU68_07780 [Terracidiphilus sp.]|nr:hypothetical protein [Terracidiphilus sp.]
MRNKILLSTTFLLGLALFAVPARASRDVVQFGSDIHVAPGSPVHDAVCFFCSVDAQGPVEHDVVVFFGDVHIHTQSGHDIVNFFGDTNVDNNATVAHDMVNFFGAIHLGENASVGNDMVAMFGSVRAADTATVVGSRVYQPFWLLLIPFCILGGIIYAIVTGVRSYRARHYYAYPMPPPPPGVPPSPPAPPVQS